MRIAVKRKGPPKKWDDIPIHPSTRAKVRMLHKAGFRLAAIAKDCNLTTAEVTRVLRKYRGRKKP
jgi:hypothetical protein